MSDSPNSGNPHADDNPYVSPDTFKPERAAMGPDGEVSLPPGQVRGMVAHIQVIGILMIIQGVMSSLYGICLGVMSTVLPQFMAVAMQNDPAVEDSPISPEQIGGIMFATYLGIGIVLLVLGVLYVVGGVRVMQIRNRSLGIVSLCLGLGTSFGCYCLPTAAGLVIYGLIVLLNEPVKMAFELRQQGATADRIRREFAKLP